MLLLDQRVANHATRYKRGSHKLRTGAKEQGTTYTIPALERNIRTTNASSLSSCRRQSASGCHRHRVLLSIRAMCSGSSSGTWPLAVTGHPGGLHSIRPLSWKEAHVNLFASHKIRMGGGVNSQLRYTVYGYRLDSSGIPVCEPIDLLHNLRPYNTVVPRCLTTPWYSLQRVWRRCPKRFVYRFSFDPCLSSRPDIAGMCRPPRRKLYR